MKKIIWLFIIGVIVISCNENNENGANDMTKEFKLFADEFEAKAAKRYTTMAEAYFKAAVKSTPENWAIVSAAEKELNALYADKANFDALSKFKGKISENDTIQLRRYNVIYDEVKSKQIDTTILNKITDKQTEIENKYSSFRAEFNGIKLSDNEVEEKLKNSKDNDELQSIWESSKEIGPIVENDIKELVQLRNESAQKLGYDNYHAMSLKLSEQDPNELLELFDELDKLTRPSYIKIKEEIDAYLSQRLSISNDELMPWHYQNRFFQEAPKIYELDMDEFYKGMQKEDLVQLTIDYYASIGMPIENIVANSSLYEEEGKNQHAFMINVDRQAKDIRTLNNVVPNARWMETLLHEFGHAVYENYYNDELPWSLKEPAHIFTTEAIAMLFGRFAGNPTWIQDMTGISDEKKNDISEVAAKYQKLQQLVFSRWVQVMYRFEKSMYEYPNQDLNKLWWDLVEKYQMIKKPEGRNMPDWATKIHIATAPCYYHNYQLGELLASQLFFTIKDKVIKTDNDNLSFKGNKKVGEFLKNNVFSVGNKYYWDIMIEKATGENLTPKYYALQFVEN